MRQITKLEPAAFHMQPNKKNRNNSPRSKTVCCFLCLLLLLASFSSCGGGNDVTSGAGTTDFPVTINDVTISSEPEGVAVLSPNLAEVVLALNYETKLKARSPECTSDDLSPLPEINVNDPESIKNTGATLVLADESLSESQRTTLTNAGLTVLVISSAKDREDLQRLYSQVGAALKGGSTGYGKGEKVANNVLITLDDIERIIPDSDTPVTACYLTNLEGGAVTGDSIQSRIFQAAGLINVATDSQQGKITDESLQASDPTYIFCITGLKDALMQSERHQGLTAVKEGRVYEMPYSYIAYQGRGMVRAATFMAGTAYPALLESNSLSSMPASSASSAPSSSNAPSSSSSEPVSSQVSSQSSSQASSEPSSSSSSQASSQSSSSSSSNSSSGSSSGSSSKYVTLKSGDSGEAVMRLQERLDELGYLYVSPTGNYLDVTVQCVKDFQLLHNMAATGIADPATQELLFSNEAKPRSAFPME